MTRQEENTSFLKSRNRSLYGLSNDQIRNECLADIAGYLADISRSLAIIADKLSEEV